MNLYDISQVMEIESSVSTQPWSPQAFALELTCNPCALYLVLETDEDSDRRIVGYMGLWHTHMGVWITTIAVAPEQSQRGWGACLLKQAQSRALDWGAKEIFLEVRKSNDQACSLYQSEGFVQIDVFFDYYHLPTEDALVFRKDLKDDLKLQTAS